ncbi:hypothetical protein PMIN06_006728 [Paraphaeosphaeria minitans]
MRFGPSCILRMAGHATVRHEEEEEDHTFTHMFGFSPTDRAFAPSRCLCQCYRAHPWTEISHVKSSDSSTDTLSQGTRIYQKYAVTLPSQLLQPYSSTPARAVSPAFYRSASE